MHDLHTIEENYKRMADMELVRLSAKPADLRLEVIPVLQKELIQRGKSQEAIYLSEFLVKTKEKPRFRDMPIEDLKKLIAERLDSGESVESIKIDLKEDGVNIFDIIDDDNTLREKAFELITHLKQQGIEEEEIDEKLKESLSIEKNESNLLKIQLKQKGKQNLVFGYSFAAIALILLIVSASLGGRITIGGIVILVTGIWRIIKGYDQLKD